MKTIIAGGRDFNDYNYMEKCLDEVGRYGWDITEVVSGGARGADQLGAEWAEMQEIMPASLFPADWSTHGKGAGFIRNGEMARYAEALVAFWDGKSKGTKHMIDTAVGYGLYVKVFYYNGENKVG